MKDSDLIRRSDVLDRINGTGYAEQIKGNLRFAVSLCPAVDAVEIPKTGIGDLSDGYHTFNGLYHQRLILFAALVKAYKDRAWKSYRHEDGELCFGGGWFIVGIDTPEGSYTYHYENKDFDLFDCEELPVGKHWDGHTEDDVTRLLSLPVGAVGVVRCRECEHSDTYPPGADNSMPLKCLGIRYGGVYPDWYCEHGQRREDGLYGSLKRGLEEAIAYERGEIELRTERREDGDET